jgi:hypothetical protein
VVFGTVSSIFNKEALLSTQRSGTKDTSSVYKKRVAMAEYQDILKFLATNPPRVDAEKQMHASLLEMLARKLRGEEINLQGEVLKRSATTPFNMKRLH